MAKIKTLYICQSCGSHSPRWQGQCFACKEWNTLVEEIVSGETLKESKSKAWIDDNSISQAKTLDNLKTPEKKDRIQTHIKELDRVLGGGLVKGSYSLLGGDPGVGKSTLLLQMLNTIKEESLYISGEESSEQIGLRASRLNVTNKYIKIAAESNLQLILELVKKHKMKVLIIDSIQSIYLPELNSAPGSVGQVRECSAKLMRLAKNKNISVILIGHVTKDGGLAGPKVLEHMVDTVLSFEGDQQNQFRLLRTLKNRFGPSNELGVFQMLSEGLVEVNNPSEIFLSERQQNIIGSVVFSAIEGSRPLLCEVQALTTSSHLPMPRRTSSGVDANRVHILIAVLDKYLKLQLNKSDVFINVVGGLKLQETAADMSIIAALISSQNNISVSPDLCFFGEVGLTGEIRACTFAEDRIKEAAKLGFTKIVAPFNNKKHLKTLDKKVKFFWVKHIQDLKNFSLLTSQN